MIPKHKRLGAAAAAHQAKVVSSRQATTNHYPRKTLRATGALILRNIRGDHGEYQGFEVAR